MKLLTFLARLTITWGLQDKWGPSVVSHFRTFQFFSKICLMFTWPLLNWVTNAAVICELLIFLGRVIQLLVSFWCILLQIFFIAFFDVTFRIAFFPEFFPQLGALLYIIFLFGTIPTQSTKLTHWHEFPPRLMTTTEMQIWISSSWLEMGSKNYTSFHMSYFQV